MRLSLDIALRALFAVIGGYLLIRVGGVAFAALLPPSRADAASVSMQLSFALYACTVVWVFTAPSAWRAIVGLLSATALCAPAGVNEGFVSRP